jgi:hypothetical protein
VKPNLHNERLKNGITGNFISPSWRQRQFTENQTSQAISDYFRIGGYSTGTENFRTERLDEYVVDCVNSTGFPATSGVYHY